ncbi:MAG TPA: PKD domain-containing protein, partial [Terriglobales bacterium]|nr:PKD domain-containing protein [Terriglobales bacterium]
MTKCWVRGISALVLIICISVLVGCGSSSSQQQGGGGGNGGSQDNHQDPAASVTLSPNSGAAGATVTVTITGNLTNFIQGQTTASFGPGTTVASGADAAFTNVTVNSPSSATAQVAISANAAPGPRFIVVATGGHNSAATFFVTNPGLPAANAGPNQQVAVGATVHLDGSGSTNPTGGPLVYAWTFLSTPSGSGAAFSSANAVNPSFTADKTGDYLIKLTVTDSASSKSTSAAVLVSTTLAPPLANAGPDQVVVTKSTVQLDGSGSTDVSGNTLTYNWVLASKPSGSTAAPSNASSVTPTFVPDVDGDYAWQLTVNDGKGNNSTAAVTISAATSPNVGSVPPLANAGLNQHVASGSTVQLDASGSHFVAVSGENGSATASVSTSSASGSSGDPLKYAWSFTSLPSGSQAALSNPNAGNPTFQADQGDATYALQLTVTDDNSKSSTSTVLISTDSL